MSKATAPMPEPPPPYQTLPPQAGDAPPPGLYPQVGAYPPPPVYPPGQPTVQVAQTPVVIATGLGPHSATVVCPKCHTEVVTRTEPVVGLLTWILAITLVVLGCGCGCCLIPCCVRECQDIDHRCPKCQHHIGLYRRL